MTAEERKKQRERILLERFLQTAGLQAEIEKERECPDFLVRFESRLIGIEVTELFVKPDQKSKENLELVEAPPLQAQEAISTKIVARAQELYQKSHAPPVGVSVCFGLGCDLPRNERERTAGGLASFIQGLNLAVGQPFDWWPEKDSGSVPPKVFSFIHALGVPNRRQAHWTVARAGWVVPLNESALRVRIDEKAKRLADYQLVVDENWLLIVADRTNPSQMFDGSVLNAGLVTSPFSRSFFFGYPEKFVVELGTSAK